MLTSIWYENTIAKFIKQMFFVLVLLSFDGSLAIKCVFMNNQAYLLTLTLISFIAIHSSLV